MRCQSVCTRPLGPSSECRATTGTLFRSGRGRTSVRIRSVEHKPGGQDDRSPAHSGSRGPSVTSRVTIVVENQTDHIPPEFFFPDATAEQWPNTSGWCPTSQTRTDGSGSPFRRSSSRRRLERSSSIRASGTARPSRCRSGTISTGRSGSGSRKLASRADGVDVVVHTHLHADHVGWDTRLVDGRGYRRSRRLVISTTRPRSRGSRDPGGYDNSNVLAQSVQPILDAGSATSSTSTPTSVKVSGWHRQRPHPRPCLVVDRVGRRDCVVDRRLLPPSRAVRASRVGRGRRLRPGRGPCHAPCRMLDEAAHDGRSRVRHPLPDPSGRTHRGPRRRWRFIPE